MKSRKIKVKNSMDITASDWGPYSSQLPGISHIHDGHKFTMAVLPGTMSSHHPVVNFQEVNGHFQILKALPDLTYYQHRYKIGAERKLLAEVEYFTLSQESAAVVIKYENSGKRAENVETFIAFQDECQRQSPVISHSPNSIVIDVKDYSEIDSSHTGWCKDCRPGIHPDMAACNSSAIYWGVGYKGKFVKLPLPRNLKGKFNLSLRYCFNDLKRKVIVEGKGRTDLVLKNTGDKYLFSEPLLFECDGRSDMILKCKPLQPPLQLDCIVLTPIGEKLPKADYPAAHAVINDIKVDPEKSISTMRAETSKDYYCLWSSNARDEKSPVGPRRNHYAMVPGATLPDAARLCNVANLLNGKLKTAGVLCIGNQSVRLQSGESFEEILLLSKGNEREFAVAQAKKDRLHIKRKINAIRKRYESHVISFYGADKNSEFAQRLAAQTLTNINYPGILGSSGQHKVRYYTPAKFYGTFYLWDMGMTGIGLSKVARQQTEDLFRQYIPADNSVPFVSWGTMLPCHIFLYWNHYQIHRDERFLAENFELAMQMYNFFAGHDPRSKMRDPQTGLLNNFEYGYNSGGWDDYPAQQRCHQIANGRIIPVVCTGQTIIAAKMLRLAALQLGRAQEVDSLTRDIEQFESLLYKYHWNENEGVFSYYDAGKSAENFLTIQGEEANKGLDGIFPLACGSLKPEHVERMVKTVTDENRFLTPFGLTTVDMTAGYYRPDGYWNGHVWVPPTWFFFRGLLNYGYVSQAKELAKRVIKSFMNASARQGAIVECLDNELGNPEHVPYFSGLTAPLLDLIDSMYGSRPVTTGPDIDATLKRDKDGWNLKVLSPGYRGKTGLLLTLEKSNKYGGEKDNGNKKIRTDRFGKAGLCLKIEQSVTKIIIRQADW